MLGLCLTSNLCAPCKDGPFGYGRQVEEMAVNPPSCCTEDGVRPHKTESELVSSTGVLSPHVLPAEMQHGEMVSFDASAFSDVGPARYANTDAVATASSCRIRDVPAGATGDGDGSRPPRAVASTAASHEDIFEESAVDDEASSDATGRGRKQVTLRSKKSNNICCNQRGDGSNTRNCMFMFGFAAAAKEPEQVDHVQLFVSHVVLDQLHDPGKRLPHGGYGTIVKVSVMETKVDGTVRFLALSDMAMSITRQDEKSGWLCLWGTGTCLNLGKSLIAGMLEMRILVETVGIDTAPRVAGIVRVATGVESLRRLLTASDRTFRLQFGQRAVGEVACSFHSSNATPRPAAGDGGPLSTNGTPIPTAKTA